MKRGSFKMTTLVDIGVNLTNKRFGEDWDAVVDRAVAAGVEAMIVTGTSARISRDARTLAARRAGVLYSTAGVHPHDAKNADERTMKMLRSLAVSPVVVAIGECGLDYNRDFSPRAVQRKVFADQLALAVDLRMPVFLHERDAHDDFRDILKEHLPDLPGAVVHCFTGSGDALQAYLSMGAHIGITGWICDERRGGPLRALLPDIPLERLMFETDAPYLVPRDLQPRPKNGRNEPAFLPHICATYAEVTGLAPTEVAEATTATARRFFDLL